MKFMLGTKEEMTQIFTSDGKAIPATVISAGPLTVTRVKTEESDGYEAVQVGFGKKKHVNKAQKKLGDFRYLKEFRVKGELSAKEGDVIDVSVFEEGDKVRVSGVSKGKGFQGVVKRHGFHGGPRTHGQKHSERAPGSIGSQGPQRVFPGTKMAGRMGTDRVTVKGSKVVAVDKKSNTLVISGAVPGRRGTLLEIRG